MVPALRTAFVGFLLLTMTACVSTKNLGGWKDENRTAPLEKVMLVAVAEHEYIRHQFENVLANHLADRGVDAVPSYKAYPELTRATKREDALAKVRELGVKSVLVIRLLSKEEVTNQTYGYSYYGAAAVQNDGWHMYYVGPILQKQKATDIAYYSLGISIFDVESTKSFWRHMFKVRDDISKEGAVNDFIPVLMKQIDKDELLPKK